MNAARRIILCIWNSAMLVLICFQTTNNVNGLITEGPTTRPVRWTTSGTMQRTLALERETDVDVNMETNSPNLVDLMTTTSTSHIEQPELDQWRDYDQLRGGLNREKFQAFFSRRPNLIAGRLWQIARTIQQIKVGWTENEAEEIDGGESSFDFAASTMDEDGNEVWQGDLDDNDRGAILCDRVSSLGPVAVKIGQTLSQRADLIGDEACNALKRLQTSNNPFDDKLAFAIIRESMQLPANVPLAPGVGVDHDDGTVKPLFAWMSEKPVAVASLGQVYKATTHDGIDVAVKVQRPDAMALLAKDYTCFKLVLGGLETGQKLIGGKNLSDESDMLSTIVDRVGADMMEELDYLKEAKNGASFEESLKFLGFVKTPKVLYDYSSERVLVTQWVDGHHLSALPREEGLKMTRMAVEACTASMVLTGFVHADPHEGNLMLDKKGNCVFLDFGLMSDVSEDVMEAFARGIQACLSKDWATLTQAFQDTGFIDNPILHKADGETEWSPFGFDPVTGVDLGLAQLAKELGTAMNEVEGGTSRFGALATVLNQNLSPRWKMATPPYVLLLIRTFLTLEGIAGRVDPNFNIYEMALPWAIRRSLSPSTKEGMIALRHTILTEDDKLQWSRLMQLLETANQSQSQSEKGMEEEIDADGVSSDKPSSSSTEAAKASAMNDAVLSLLGSPEGVVLRQILKDLDSIDLLERLLSKDARPLRRKAALAIAERKSKSARRRASPLTSKVQSNSDESVVARPVSEACRRLQQKQNRIKQKVLLCLMAKHLRQVLQAGPKAWIQSLYLAIRVTAGAVHQKLKQKLRLIIPSRRLRPV